jgi:hypothetical protein
MIIEMRGLFPVLGNAGEALFITRPTPVLGFSGKYVEHSAILAAKCDDLRMLGGIRVYDWPMPHRQADVRDLSGLDGVELPHSKILRIRGVSEMHDDSARMRVLARARRIWMETPKLIGFRNRLSLYRVIPSRTVNCTVKIGNTNQWVPFVGSCAGYVEECYAATPHPLVLGSESQLPEVTIEMLQSIATTPIRPEDFASKFGSPPYHPLTPGYQLQSFKNGMSFPRMPASVQEAFY